MKILLLLAIVFFLGTTVLWLSLDKSPPPWDDAFYLTNSLKLYDALFEGGVPAYSKTFLRGMDSKPPLISVLPTPVYLIFGRHPRAAYSINLIFLAITFGALYRIASHYCNSVAGFLAVYIAGTMPMIYALSRWFLVECGLIALVCLAICLIVELEDSDTILIPCALGATCGLGLLMKASFPLYVAVPLLYFAARSRRALVRRNSVVAFAIPIAIIAMPWYLFNAYHALGTAIKAGSSNTASAYGTGDIWSFAAIKDYLINLVNTGPAIYFVALAVLLAIRWRAIGPAARKGLLLCALWGSPVVVLIFGHYRDLRYAAPLLPALAVALAIVAEAAIRGPVAKLAGCALLALPMLSMLQSSFHLWGDRSFELGGLLLNVPRFYYARAYDRTLWPNDEILSDICRVGKCPSGETRALVVGSDTLHFNADNVKLMVARKRLPLDVSTTAYDQNPSALLQRVNAAAYFVYQEGGETASPFNSLAGTALQVVQESGRFAELPIGRRMPDGGTLHVFANVASTTGGPTEDPIVGGASGAFIPGRIENPPDCDVRFADRMRLSGFALNRTADGLKITYRWQCMQPPQLEYWCFTHLLDERGNIIRNLDHKILQGKPPLTSWKPGDTAIETVVVPGATGPYRISVGLYDVVSGKRLAIAGSTLPMGEDQTAVVVKETDLTPRKP